MSQFSVDGPSKSIRWQISISKFFEIVIYDILAEILISTVRAQFLGDWLHFFSSVQYWPILLGPTML